MTKEYDHQTVAEGENPPHVHITEEPPGTPWDVRLGLTLLPARYVLRSVVQSLTNSDTPPVVQKYSGIEALRNRKAKPVINEINALYAGHQPHIVDYFAKNKGYAPGMGKTPNSFEIEAMLGEPRFKTLIEKNKALHRYSGASRDAFNSLEYAIKEYFGPSTQDKIQLTHESRGRINSGITGKMFDWGYDNALGVGSWGMSLLIRHNVRKEMHAVYSEAVSYEMNKDASQVSMDDIFNSQNRIIQSTSRNYDRYQWARFGISTLPFMKNIPRLSFFRFGDMAVGLWGAMWAFDVWGRDPTMLETFHNFIKDKLNPLYGIGDKIKGSDILNMYQHYVFKFHPERSFRTVALNDADESRLWAQSEKIFTRVADLMNASYNFKHTAVNDPKTGLPKRMADFTLPKFIFLLGHDMINARQPEWSMAFIEVANRYGMDAVKEVARARRSGTSLTEILQKYPVDLNPPRIVISVPFEEKLAMHSPQSFAVPAARMNESTLKTPAARTAPTSSVHTGGLQQTSLKAPEQLSLQG